MNILKWSVLNKGSSYFLTASSKNDDRRIYIGQGGFLIYDSGLVQGRSQPDIWRCKWQFFSVYTPYKESIFKEMNNNVLNLHTFVVSLLVLKKPYA